MTPPVACLDLSPWPLTLLAWEHPGVPVAVLGEGSGRGGGGRRVTQVCGAARAAGVQPGLREDAALSRCPELHAEVVAPALAQAAWDELLELLYARFSDRVEGQGGVAWLALGAAGARELAAALRARVGVAHSAEVARLSALRATPGEARVDTFEPGGGAERAFLSVTPLAHLLELGLDTAMLERLDFLGVRRLGELQAWSASAREAFLGVDAARTLRRFLSGERRTRVARYRPGQVLRASVAFDRPVFEPAEAEAALADLTAQLWTALQGRVAGRLRVQVGTALGQHEAARRLKWPLDQGGLRRAAFLALGDCGALPLGAERLSADLSGLAAPARMVGLWPGLADLDVTAGVLERYPDALLRVRWLDPWAYAADAQYEWVDWQTGEVRPTRLSPPRAVSAPARARHEGAVQRVLAFFEGAGEGTAGGTAPAKGADLAEGVAVRRAGRRAP